MTTFSCDLHINSGRSSSNKEKIDCLCCKRSSLRASAQASSVLGKETVSDLFHDISSREVLVPALRIGALALPRARSGGQAIMPSASQSEFGSPSDRQCAINGTSIPPRARKNTIIPNPMWTVEVDLQADNPGDWAFQCHNIYRAESGMMPVVRYQL